MFEAYQSHLQTEIPDRPQAKFAHIIVLRRTESYAVFKTDGELNTAKVQAGLSNTHKITRLSIFKRKQSTPERLTGRELLRRYDAISPDCKYNESFCGKCPDCVVYGYAIGDTGSEKSKVYVDTAFSISSYDESHETMTLNAPYEDGTMTKGGATTNRFSEQDHVVPETYFPSVVTLRDPTAHTLAYVINNLRRTKLYGAQTTRTGHMHNHIAALVFADGEIFSNLRLTQAMHDLISNQQSTPEDTVVPAVRELIKKDGVVYQLVEGAELDALLQDLDTKFTDASQLQSFLTALSTETQAYFERIQEGGKSGKKKGK